jgi:hypothetical protein
MLDKIIVEQEKKKIIIIGKKTLRRGLEKKYKAKV